MTGPLVFPGLHQPSDAQHFARCCVSIRRLQTRRKPLGCPCVLVDSGSFTTIELNGGFPDPPEVYAAQLLRLHRAGVVEIAAAVTQDFMCEPFMVARTGLSVAEHQRLTVERYDALAACGLPFPIMPVLQGYRPEEYLDHLAQYGDRLAPGMWVGVGSVCKRQGDPARIVEVLLLIKLRRPDLRLHGFGIKTIALRSIGVRELLHSVDSMAWSDSAAEQSGLHVRKLGAELGRRVKPAEARRILLDRGITLRNPNDWREARAFEAAIAGIVPVPTQLPLHDLAGCLL